MYRSQISTNAAGSLPTDRARMPPSATSAPSTHQAAGTASPRRAGPGRVRSQARDRQTSNPQTSAPAPSASTPIWMCAAATTGSTTGAQRRRVSAAARNR
jgi:hypothetical protein